MCSKYNVGASPFALYEKLGKVSQEIRFVAEKYRHYQFWTNVRTGGLKILKPTERNVKTPHFEFFLYDNNDAVDCAITIVSDLQMLGYFYLPDANLSYSARNEVELMMTVLRKDSKTYRTALEEKGMLLLYYILSQVP
jgi:hypothetical protein